MTERILPGIGLTGYWDQGAPWKVGGDQNWLRSSVLTQLAVESATTSLPASPLNGVIYIVPVGDANANQVAARDNGAWVYMPPQEGWTAYVRDTGVLMNFDGSAWVPAAKPLADALAAPGGAGFVGWLRNAVGAVATTVLKWLERQPASPFDFMTDAEIADVKAGTFLLDVTAAVQKALDAGPSRIFGGGYLVTDTLVASFPVDTDGTWPVFKFVRAAAPSNRGALLLVDGGNDVSGLVIDGTGSDQTVAGVLIEASYYAGNARTNYDLRVNAVKNSDPTKACYGVLYFVESGAAKTSVKTCIKAEVNGVVATANGSPGDSAGASAGVHVSINKTGMTNEVEVWGSAAGVRPVEDGDGFNIFDADYLNGNSKSSYRLMNVKAADNSKRGIKSIAPNCVIPQPFIDCDLTTSAASTTIGIDCYGVNNVVLNPIVLSSYISESICGRAAGFKLVNPTIIKSGLGFPIRIDTACTDFEVLDGEVRTTASYGSGAAGAIFVGVGCRGYIRAPLYTNTGSTGSVVALQGLAAADTIVIDAPRRNKALSLVFARTCASKVQILNAVGDCTGNVVDLSACNDVRISRLVATTTGQWAVSSPLSTLKMIGGGEVSGMTLGAVTAPATANGDGIQIVSGAWRFKGNGATVGVDVTSAVNPEVMGITTEGFADHIKYNATTKAAIGNNLARGAGNPLLGTGAVTPYLFNNNVAP